MFVFRKKFKQLSYGYEDPFENSKNWANFTKNFKFLPKTRTNCILRYNIVFAYFLKRCQEVLRRTSVGENLWRTSVGGNIRLISSNWLKIGHIVHQDRYFFHTFFKKTSEGPRKDVGRGKSQKDIGRRNFRKYVGREKQIGRLLPGYSWKDVGRRKIVWNLRRKSVGGNIMTVGGGLHFFRLSRPGGWGDNFFCLNPLKISEMMH